MQQLFRATILHGTISPTESSTTLELVILQAAKRKHRNHQFMRFLLAELLECQFIPSLLLQDEFAPLLDALVDRDTHIANSVEINAVNFNTPYNPEIVATAEFILPVRYKLSPFNNTYELGMSKGLQEAIRFYWKWPGSSGASGDLDVEAMDEKYHRLYSDTISFELVEPT